MACVRKIGLGESIGSWPRVRPVTLRVNDELQSRPTLIQQDLKCEPIWQRQDA